MELQRTHWIIVLLALLDVELVILFILGHHVKVYGATRKVTPRQKEQIPSVDLKLVYMRAWLIHCNNISCIKRGSRSVEDGRVFIWLHYVRMCFVYNTKCRLLNDAIAWLCMCDVICDVTLSLLARWACALE